MREQLYEGGCEKDLGTFIERPVAELLISQLRDHGSVRLRLAEELPAFWHSCAYERLLLDGEEIFGRLVVERYVSTKHWHMGRPIPQNGVLFDFLADKPTETFPTGERHAFYSAVDNRKLQSTARICLDKPVVDHYLEQKDLSHTGFLCIIAHGSETSARFPFQSADGSAFQLSLDSGLPPIVILLICGGFDGNLIDYGRHLITKGASTVIASIGKISAPRAGEFLDAFISSWNQGGTVTECLGKAQMNDTRAIGSRRLVLLGNGDLHAGEFHADEMSDVDINEAARADDIPALTTLIDRITFDAYHREGNAGTVVSELYRRLCLPYDDPNEGAESYLKFVAVADQVSPLSQYWLRPYLGFLAQVHDHPSMQRYLKTRKRAEGQDAWLPDSPIFYHYLATPDYRNGLYIKGVKKLVAGFNKIVGETACHQAGIKLLGNLINHLIDLGLPDEADLLAIELKRCLEVYEGDTEETDRFTLMDREARIALRQGQTTGASDEHILRAVTLFDKKRIESIANGEDGSRELAWLLYVTAWGEVQEAQAYADKVLAFFDDVKSVSQDISKGNDTRLYLLRALALWAWRGRDEHAAERVDAFLDALSRRGFYQDTGPLGFAAAYLALYRGDKSSEQWTKMKVLMEQDRYWLELTAFGYLMSDFTATQKYLEHFQHQRRVAFEQLKKLPAWLAKGAFIGQNWQEKRHNLGQRERWEASVFNTEVDSPQAETIVHAGLLPM
ncbi:MAG: hypothetical protein QNJ78_09265 [Gammaproteobacteria bacterium]|nr:hypothetical protein [Gammaproteobacteria bacterium]